MVYKVYDMGKVNEKLSVLKDYGKEEKEEGRETIRG